MPSYDPGFNGAIAFRLWILEIYENYTNGDFQFQWGHSLSAMDTCPTRPTHNT